MATFKFKEEELFNNTMKVYPSYKFMIYSGTVFIDAEMQDSGAFGTSSLTVPEGYISLYELNIDRVSGSNNLIYPFITKNGSLQNFATVTTSSWHNSFAYGDIITGSYPLSSSLYRNYYVTASAFPLDPDRTLNNQDQYFYQRKHVYALENTLNSYLTLSPHYEYKSALGDKSRQELNLISIPSIFYGSQIKKGSVKLNFYITGTLIGTLSDEKRNGELIQRSGSISTNDGEVAGVVLYNEGFIILTGSWDLHNDTLNYVNDTTNLKKSKWVYWGAGIEGFAYDSADIITGSHCDIEFSGSNYIQTLTMLAQAAEGDLNHSNNPTYIDKSSGNLYDASSFITSSGAAYFEKQDCKVVNVTETHFQNMTGSFKKTTFISRVGIYDENMNLIAIAKTAEPVKKLEDREYTFKLKLDF